MKQKRFDPALDSFDQVLALQATYPNTHYYIGLIHEMRGDEATARKHYVREVNHGACLGAWNRIWTLNRQSPRPRPKARAVMTFSAALLVVAAIAYGLRLYLEARREGEPSLHGVD